MIRYIFIIFLFLGSLVAQIRTPVKYWESLEMSEKIAFINGVYSAGAKFKFHHKQEVKKQFNQDPNWVEPYYIERFYNIVDEHRSQEAGYEVDVVAKGLDAFYSNYDNTAIPLLEALRIVSLTQDGKTEKADLYLLKAQKRYKP
jgi:hypothetical protein